MLAQISDIKVIDATEQQQAYPEHLSFNVSNRTEDERRFWFFDGLHHPRPIKPFETIIPEAVKLGMCQMATRTFRIPGSNGVEQVVLNGYVFLSPNLPTTTGEEYKRRTEQFIQRSQNYFENWDTIYDGWKQRMTDLISDIEDIVVPALPEFEPIERVIQANGSSSSTELLNGYSNLIEHFFQAWQYHFEMLNLGYGAYQSFVVLARELFPTITPSHLGEMLAGDGVVFLRPKAELERLANIAITTNLTNAVLSSADIHEFQETAGVGGITFCEDYFETSAQWFVCSIGTGFYSDELSWQEQPKAVWAMLQNHVTGLLNNTAVTRPQEDVIARRNQLFQGYLELIDDIDRRDLFRNSWQLAIKVAPFLEDHNFYVEHWCHTVFFRKIREYGAVLTEFGCIREQDDIFYLNRYEIAAALYQSVASWTMDSPGRASKVNTIDRRKAMFARFEAFSPPPALGAIPEALDDPLVGILWGIDQNQVAKWSRLADNQTVWNGIPASRGKIKGRACKIISGNDLSKIQKGDILICRSLAPSWVSAFPLIAGVVAEVGGTLSHSAITCREYGIPAVVNASGIMSVTDGDDLIVDGDTGEVLMRNNSGARNEF